MPFVAHRVFGWHPVVIDDSWGLKSIANGHAYSICKSLYCSKCNFLFLDIRFTDKEMSRLYAGYRDSEYVALREYYEPDYRLQNQLLNEGITYLDQVEKFIQPHLKTKPSILDWGGDTGRNSPFKTSNSVLDIYDISGKIPIAGANLVSKQQIKEKKYDLIVCSQVLEHVPYPSDVLQEIRACMHADSLLYLELPHEDLMKKGLEAPAHAKRHWHEHINFFSPSALEHLLERHGLRATETRSIEVESAKKRVNILQMVASII